MNSFPFSKHTVVLGVYFYYFLFRKSLVLTEIIPNIDHKHPGGGTSDCGEWERSSSDVFFLPLLVESRMGMHYSAVKFRISIIEVQCQWNQDKWILLVAVWNLSYSFRSSWKFNHLSSLLIAQIGQPAFTWDYLNVELLEKFAATEIDGFYIKSLLFVATQCDIEKDNGQKVHCQAPNEKLLTVELPQHSSKSQ